MENVRKRLKELIEKEKRNHKEADGSRKYRQPLRRFLAWNATFTICFSCIVSCVLVLLGVKLFYTGTVTNVTAMVMCIIVCILTMLIAGLVTNVATIHVTSPLLRVNESVKNVAEGDFTVQLKEYSHLRGNYPYLNEIDELIDNVNKMARELNHQDYLRKDFMSNVSHEVKTPIAAITGFTEILMDGGLTKAEEQEYLKLVNEESQRLSRLCESMLRMSRLDNQEIVEKKDIIQLDEQIRKCIILLSEKWSAQSMIFELDLADHSIVSNADMLKQVWINVIDNAIKYSNKESRIWVSERVTEDTVTITIRDEGDGIKQEKLSRLFDKFYQCEESHKKKGSGLGLSIVKRIVELLGGNIQIESKVGIGTTVTILIPIEHQ